MDNPLFNVGFPQDRPTPAEVDSLPTRVAILSGTSKGMVSAVTSVAQDRLNQVEGTANTITDAMLAPANDALASIGQLQTAISTAGQQTALNAIQGPLKVGQALGYVSQGTPILTPKTTRKRANGRSTAPQGSISQPATLSQVISPMQITDLSRAPAQSQPQPSELIKPPTGGATLPACGVVAFTTEILGTSVVTLLSATDPRVSASIAAGGQWVAYPDIATARAAYPQPPWSVNDYSAGAQPCSVPPPGGGVTPTFPMPPGGIPQPTVPVVIKPPPIGGIPVPPPPPPPAPPPCPCPNISILIPLPAQPPPNIAITVPPCPQCGAQGQPVIFPLPAPSVPVIVPAPPINVNVPPCPKCGSQLPPITIQNNTGPVNVTIPPAGGGTTPTASPVSPPPVLPPPSICETCTIPWLNLHYPDFVLASRAAQKTDYDILVDAVNLKLCCGEPLQPGCSMPFLQRMMPEFVSAAKAQGLSDDEVLQQAVNIGLCADVLFTAGLGESQVGYTAPGSAAAEASEFDPSARGEAHRVVQQAINTDPTAFCNFEIPFSKPVLSVLTNFTPEQTDCLAGLAKPLLDYLQWVMSTIQSTCSCDDASAIAALGLEANKLWNTQTILGKGAYYVLNGLIWLLRTGACSVAQVSGLFSSATNCDGPALSAIVVVQTLMGVWKRWVGELPPMLDETLQRVQSLTCPTGLPNAAEASDLLASNFISKDQWTCFQRAAGNIPAFQQPLVQARQSRPNDEDLWQRSQYLIARLDQIAATPAAGKPGEAESITKEISTINDLFKSNGWTNDKWFTEWLNTKQWVPTTSDAIQWMIKDVNDPQIVQTFLLDAEFQQKYGGDVKRAFDQNAVSQGDAENIWKSHWRNVSPHQLYEMHKRLRPGWTKLLSDEEVLSFVQAICPRKSPQVTPEVMAARPISNGFPVPTYCDEVPDPATARTYLESIVVTGYHASEALGQDDFPAFWRPRLLALSYNVLTRVDARRAYELGLFSDEKLISIYEDRGYKHSDAVALVDFAHAQLVQRFVRSATAKQWIQYPYQTGMLQQNLEDDGMRPDLFDEVLPILERKRAVFNRIQQLQQVKKAVVNGRMNKQNAVAAVGNILKG